MVLVKVAMVIEIILEMFCAFLGALMKSHLKLRNNVGFEWHTHEFSLG